MTQYYVILTQTGEAKLSAATALGQTLKLTTMAVGDGNGSAPQPSSSQTTLVNEQRRAPINTLSIGPQNPAQIIAEQIIPEDIGGWWIREVGLYDQAGDLIAVANCPDTYKPLLSSGSGRTQIIRMVLVVSSTAAIELKIDPAVVLATRDYVDANHKQLLALLGQKLNNYSRTYTVTGEFTVPAGVNRVYLTAIGGGGAGGGAGGNSTGNYCPGGGGGGDAGEFVIQAEINVTPGEKIPVVIGEGGVGGLGGTISAISGKQGGSGGNTIFGHYLTLKGGQGGKGGSGISQTDGGLSVGGASDGQDGYLSSFPLGGGGSGASSPFGTGGGACRSGAGTGSSGKQATGYGTGGGASAPYATKTNAQRGGHGAPGMLTVQWWEE